MWFPSNPLWHSHLVEASSTIVAQSEHRKKSLVLCDRLAPLSFIIIFRDLFVVTFRRMM